MLRNFTALAPPVVKTWKVCAKNRVSCLQKSQGPLFCINYPLGPLPSSLISGLVDHQISDFEGLLRSHLSTFSEASWPFWTPNGWRRIEACHAASGCILDIRHGYSKQQKIVAETPTCFFCCLKHSSESETMTLTFYSHKVALTFFLHLKYLQHYYG